MREWERKRENKGEKGREQKKIKKVNFSCFVWMNRRKEENICLERTPISGIILRQLKMENDSCKQSQIAEYHMVLFRLVC